MGLFNANSCEKIIKPLLSRFLVLEISAYTFEEFRDIALSRLAKEKGDKSFASIIAEKVWNELGSRDARDVVKVGRLASSIQDVSLIIKMMKKR